MCRSWHWTFILVSIFSGVLVPFIILFVPEHAFNREAAQSRIKTSTSSSEENIQKLTNTTIQEQGQEPVAPLTRGWGPFLPQLRLFTGRKSNENPIKILLRPFPLMLHPAILWGSLTQGTLIVFLVAISAVIAEIFGGPPNFFSNSKVGFFYIGPFIGGIIGFAAGILALFLGVLVLTCSGIIVRLVM